MSKRSFLKGLAVSLLLGLSVQTFAYKVYLIEGTYNTCGKDKRFVHYVLDSGCSRTGTYGLYTKNRKFLLSNLRPSIYEKFETKIISYNKKEYRCPTKYYSIPKKTSFTIKLTSCKEVGRVSTGNMRNKWNGYKDKISQHNIGIEANRNNLTKINTKFDRTIDSISNRFQKILDTHQTETIKNEVKNSINSDDLKAIIRQVVREELSGGQ